mgnify:CR=1 FL=1
MVCTYFFFKIMLDAKHSLHLILLHYGQQQKVKKEKRKKKCEAQFWFYAFIPRDTGYNGPPWLPRKLGICITENFYLAVILIQPHDQLFHYITAIVLDL